MANYRKKLGTDLRKLRLESGLTAYRVAKNGNIQIGQVNAVEKGDTNYTVDIFFCYLRGCGLEFHILPKILEK